MSSLRPAVHIARGASYLIVRTIVNSGVSITAFAIIARLISKNEMGEVVVLMLITNGAALLAGMGVSSTATKFVASFNAKDEYEKMRRAGYGCLIINLMATAIISIAIYFSSDLLASFLFGNIAKGALLRLLLLEIVAISMTSSLAGILTGLKLFRQLSLVSMMTFTVRQFLVVILLWLGWGVSGIVIGWGIGDSLSSVILTVYTRKFLGPVRLGFGLAKLLRFSAPLFLGEVATYAWTWFDRGLLLPLASLAELGSYNVAVTAYGMLDAFPSAISGTLFPFYSQFHPDEGSQSQKRDLEMAVHSASRYLAFITIPLAIGLAATALPAATLLAGSSYADAALPLSVLAISLAIACQIRALSSVLVVLGRTVTSALVTIASVVIPIFLGIFLVKELGTLGASLARGASLVILLLLSMIILKRIMKLRLDMKAYKSAWIASLVMGVVVLGAQQIFYNKYLLVLYVGLGALVFLLAMRQLRAVTREDMDLLSDFLGPRMKFVTRWVGKVIGTK